MKNMSRRAIFGLGGVLGFQALSSALVAAPRPGAKCSPDAGRPAGATLFRSESFTIQWLDRALRIDIALPMDVLPGSTLMVTNSKPVPIYVLDAPTDFPMAASTARLMQWGGEVPPCLTIGIGYADAETGDKENWRSRDLTPNKTPGINRSGSTDGFGAGPAFRRFLVETLRPMIERRFDVDGARSVLVGHSLAGMFTLDTMVQSPTAFANYLAMSPALWFDEELVLRQLKASLENGTTFPGRVAVFAGEQEERISRPSAHMTSNTLEFGRLVADHRGRFPAGAMVKVLPDTTHHTIIGPALAKGLRFLIAPEARRMETF